MSSRICRKPSRQIRLKFWPLTCRYAGVKSRPGVKDPLLLTPIRGYCIDMQYSHAAGSSVSAVDVAHAVLDRLGPIDSYKLQKILYYAQAWHLAWYNEPLFSEEIEAWRDGPVVRQVWGKTAGLKDVKDMPGADKGSLSDGQLRALNAVIDRYGQFSGEKLSEMTHAERPWRQARADLPEGASSTEVIPKSGLGDYYATYGDSEFKAPTDAELDDFLREFAKF